MKLTAINDETIPLTAFTSNSCRRLINIKDKIKAILGNFLFSV